MKKMIKNYTTAIPVEKTIAEIQQLLAQNGARGIAIEYDERGTIKDIFFKIRLHDKELPFRLPSKPENVYAALFAGMQYEDRLRNERMKKAEAIAWRICKTRVSKSGLQRSIFVPGIWTSFTSPLNISAS